MLSKFAQMFCSACEPQTMHSGVTDIIVVKDNKGKLNSTAFYACIGTWDLFETNNKVNIQVNGVDIEF
jgi:phosphatidate phosphatase PAH1